MQGIVVSCDPWFASLFGYPNTPAVMGQSIFTLIPSISLPHSLEDWEKVNCVTLVVIHATYVFNVFMPYMYVHTFTVREFDALCSHVG